MPVVDPGFDLRVDVDFVNGGLGVEIKKVLKVEVKVLFFLKMSMLKANKTNTDIRSAF